MDTQRFVYSLLLASAAVVGLASSAYSFTLTDNYIGATDNYHGTPQDIIGNSPPFSITSADITRSGPGNDTLNIVIHTNYAGAPGTGPAFGTGYGSLFLNPFSWSGSNPGTNDSWVLGNQSWAYAVTNTSGATDATQPAFGMYAIGTVGGSTSKNGAAQYYTTTDGTVYMSYINGNGNPTDPATSPKSPTGGDYFRQGQAVQYIPGSGETSPNYAATFTVDPLAGTLTYTIVDMFALGDTFALSWAMTCSNDIIQGLVTLGSTDLQGTPIPAALPLFAGGLGVMGLLARRKKRKGATATATAA